MDQQLKNSIARAVENEPYARALKIRLVALKLGYSVVEMVFTPQSMGNIYGRAHGGALFALIDEAFETASQTHGDIAVALNVNVTYVLSPQPGEQLRAEAREVALTRKTVTYEIKVTNPLNDLVAVCQAVAYRTGRPVQFNEAG
jgi:acyl-CoA thioesterase